MNKPIKKIIQIIGWYIKISLVISLIGAMIFVGLEYYETHKIKIGMNKKEVLTIRQNRPPKTLKTLDEFCQTTNAFNKTCQRTDIKTPSHFMIFNVGIETIQIVGFDEQDKVIFLANN